MKIICLRVVLMLAGLAVPLLASGVEIVVKGLTKGSAILELDGELTILRDGESRGPVTLISATNRAAVLDVHGKRQTLGLDRSIAKTYKPPEPERISRTGSAFLYQQQGQVADGASSLLSVKLVDEQPGRVALGVEYVYAGDYGEEVFITADTLENQRSTGHSEPVPVRLLAGKHYVELEVTSRAAAPLVYTSDALQIAVHWNDENGRRGSILKRVLPFQKFWKKVKVR